MFTPILATKLYIPPPRPNVVLRPRLIERLNQGLQHKLTVISAPAGFGKTTLLSEWIADFRLEIGDYEATNPNLQSATSNLQVREMAWLSLDEGDNDPARFLAYLVAALQMIAPTIGAGVLGALQAPHARLTEAILTALLNDITTIPEHFVLVLDDYHVIDAKPIAAALTFLLEHQPPQMHLVVATREDPPFPLARLRARGQLSELRAADLRFTHVEAATFLRRVMGLNLSAENIAVLEERTEGWIAGLQLAALSMQGQQDAAGFIRSFTGSHRFVLDYLVEEVLQQQSASIQAFLLHTSILGRLCASLCDAVLLDASASAQATLEYLERANLFIIPLDSQRHWYRYHHLFAELLRQRLHQTIATSTGEVHKYVNELHIRASQWYEDHGLDIEAFEHAAAANDVARAERLIEGHGIPLHLRGAVTTILDWLASLPITELDARPALWWRYASLLLVNGQTTGVEEKLDAAEAGLQDAEAADTTRNLIGRIATARAVLALTRYQIEIVIAQSRRALSYLHPSNLFNRANANWTLGVAYFLQGERSAARRAYTEAIAISQASGDSFTTILATIGLGNVEQADNQLYRAAETYRRVLGLAGEQPLQIIYDAHLGLAQVLYEWNDLSGAEQHGRQSIQLARQYDREIDRFIVCEVFLARLKLAQGSVVDAADLLAQASQSARQHNFVHRLPEIAAAQVLTLLHQGNLAAAAQLAQAHDLPLSQARISLAQGDTFAALAVLIPYRQQIEAKGWQDERLKVMALQAVVLYMHGEKDKALQLLGDALALAEPGGFIRLFVDQGMPMAQLLSQAAAQEIMPDYVGRVLAAFGELNIENEALRNHVAPTQAQSSVLVAPFFAEPLSQRELEILRLIAQGLSNREIGARLFLALDTVKGHNQKLFGKLHVQRRTEAVARARELGLL